MLFHEVLHEAAVEKYISRYMEAWCKNNTRTHRQYHRQYVIRCLLHALLIVERMFYATPLSQNSHQKKGLFFLKQPGMFVLWQNQKNCQEHVDDTQNMERNEVMLAGRIESLPQRKFSYRDFKDKKSSAARQNIRRRPRSLKQKILLRCNAIIYTLTITHQIQKRALLFITWYEPMISGPPFFFA